MKYSINVVINNKETGRKIRTLMQLHNLTVENFASEIGVSETTTINKWLAGKSHPCTKYVLAIMHRYNVKLI